LTESAIQEAGHFSLQRRGPTIGKRQKCCALIKKLFWFNFLRKEKFPRDRFRIVGR
jgi:hypothetical protein